MQYCYGLNHWGLIPNRGRDFCVHHQAKTNSTVFNVQTTDSSFPGGNAAGLMMLMKQLHLIPELQIPIPPPHTIHVHFCVLSLLKIYFKN